VRGRELGQRVSGRTRGTSRRPTPARRDASRPRVVSTRRRCARARWATIARARTHARPHARPPARTPAPHRSLMSEETPPTSTTDATREMIRARSAQVVLIQDSKGLGTGVVVGADGWVLTNKHVAPSVGPFRVILANGSNVTGVGLHQSPHHDLAIVKVGAAT